MATTNYRRRVGAVRPSHLMFTSGVGALVDLPNFSVLVSGIEEWNYSALELTTITEPRLLTAVSTLLRKEVKELRPAPWMDGIDTDPTGPASRVGVPVIPFPAWLRCTVCNTLGPIDGGEFGFQNDKPRKPHEARFYHEACKRSRRKPLAVAARFVLACAAGHMDEFPYVDFVHEGAGCAKASHPRLRMDDKGGNLGANVMLECTACGAKRNINQAFGRRAEVNLPRCRGRHPHLGPGVFEAGCKRQPVVLVVGASNQWFAQVMSTLSVPRPKASQLATLVDHHWGVLSFATTVDQLGLVLNVASQLASMKSIPPTELWAAVEERRNNPPENLVKDGYPDLRTPEWQIFTAADPPRATEDFTLRRDPDGVPPELKTVYADVVQVERLREVRALIGFTRLDAPDPDDPQLVARAPLSRVDPTWVPASEVRGEGIFLRLPEKLMLDWEQRIGGSAQMRAHREAYARFRRNRYSDRITGTDFDPMRLWPGERYIALHTLSHLLIRTIALECGYSSASLSERIYAGDARDPRAGILIYTAVPDAEGTLGGLVTLAEPEQLVRLTRRALRDAQHCSSDPLCAERLPHDPADYLHGAACHVCLFVSETTCERGNRFLDRRFVVPLEDPGLALLPDLP